GGLGDRAPVPRLLLAPPLDPGGIVVAAAADLAAATVLFLKRAFQFRLRLPHPERPFLRVPCGLDHSVRGSRKVALEIVTVSQESRGLVQQPQRAPDPGSGVPLDLIGRPSRGRDMPLAADLAERPYIIEGRLLHRDPPFAIMSALGSREHQVDSSAG